MKFTFVNWGFWVAQFATMLLWVARFPLMPEQLEHPTGIPSSLFLEGLGLPLPKPPHQEQKIKAAHV